MFIKRSKNNKNFLHGIIILLFVGVLTFVAEHYGEGHINELITWIESSGNFAPVVFILINVLGMVLALPLTLFTAVAGVLFGAIKGAAVCLISMAIGSSLSFFLGRFVFRDRILKKFGDDPNFKKIRMLSESHPVKVLALSRIVPVVPYSIANYLWSVTDVKYIPYLIMSIVCLIPETVFMTAGGHILSTGVVKGTLNWEMFAVLSGAGLLIFFLSRAVRKSLENS
ncbi:TVP38/TMEM64 family protein [Maridesulfovibrio hydrothermalis]|uniref:TVP38/TMEM64 family membrane protein n=1 Tax=Maridesulfovibrio hydrothermalis AM13 = DSM 14728 TaxID=1121451 RepID=L0RE37_9BACT|nr:TVP38/TMEM64 family protein [Maridesulfovibrio hydrothermalis]CCO25019.1 SNARE associated Golgi protein [Maridesulfovibrio hydrothermalis AM13 = DSM 14728]